MREEDYRRLDLRLRIFDLGVKILGGVLALFIAYIGLIGPRDLQEKKHYANLETQKREFEAGLILQAMNSGQDSIVRKKLEFLLEMQLLELTEEKIINALSDTSRDLSSFGRGGFATDGSGGGWEVI